jgi:hypothetical protein
MRVGSPKHGTAAPQPNGYVLYTPLVSFSQAFTDTFVVTIGDGHGGAFQRRVVVKTFAAISGTFQGLLVNNPPVSVNNNSAIRYEGQATVTLNASASFTALIKAGREVLRLKGTLAGPLTSAQNIRLASGQTARVSFEYDDLRDTWAVTMTGGLELQTQNPLPRVATAAQTLHGRYTSAFMPMSPLPNLAAVGFTGIGVSSTGAIILSGRLADGQLVNATSRLLPNGEFSIYQTPGARGAASSSVSGIMKLSTATIPDDVEGQLQWRDYPLQPPGPPATEVATLDVRGARYLAPANGHSVFNGTPAPMRFDLQNDGGPAATVDLPTVTLPKSTFDGQSTNVRVGLTVNRVTGLATGWLLDLNSHARRSLCGVVLQSQSQVVGLTDALPAPRAWTIEVP